jgi:VWFA-related protein
MWALPEARSFAMIPAVSAVTAADSGMVFANGRGRSQSPMIQRNRAHRVLQLALAGGAALSALATAGPALAQQSTSPRALPTFSSAVDVVNLNVSVSDGRDRHITGLAVGDFRVLEDGVPQQLCLFTQERLPISLAILIDSSLSMQPSLPAVKTAALRLVRALGPGDQAEIIQFNHKFTVLQDFTNQQGLLEGAVRGIRAEGATGVYNALYLTLKDPRFRRTKDDLTRQAVAVLSDGEDTSSLVSDDQVLELARKGNVTVFTISLTQPRPSSLDSDAPDRAAFFLSALARQTGGRSYFPSGLSQIDGVYDKIADELRTQYALGYVSSNPQRDGKWRRIAIETTQKNLLLRHKQGYYAGALRALRSALSPQAPKAGMASTLPRRQETPQP